METRVKEGWFSGSCSDFYTSGSYIPTILSWQNHVSTLEPEVSPCLKGQQPLEPCEAGLARIRYVGPGLEATETRSLGRCKLGLYSGL